jgi:hypothetical protein
LSQTPSIKLDSVFQAPIVRAQFDVLLVLAGAMAPSLPDLYQLATNWNRVVGIAAEALTSQTAKVKTIGDAIAIWDRVLGDLDVARMSAPEPRF